MNHETAAGRIFCHVMIGESYQLKLHGTIQTAARDGEIDRRDGERGMAHLLLLMA